MQTSHVPLGSDQSDSYFSRACIRCRSGEMEAYERLRFLLREYRKCMDFGRIEVLPTPNLLGGSGMSEDNRACQEGVELSESFFMTVIGFILRYDDDVGGRNVGKMVDTGWDCMFREGELWVKHRGVARKPGV